MIKTLDYSKDKKLGQLVRDRDTKGIGKHVHEELLSLIADNNRPAQTLFALSEQRYVIGEAAYDTHKERHQAATLIGRECVQEFGDEKILYLLMSAPVVSASEDSGFLPNDDPHRKTGAMTFIISLEKLHAATDFEEYVETLKYWDYFVWSSDHHEGLVTEVIWDGATVAPSAENQREPEEGEVFAEIENYNLMAFFTAISGNFELIRTLSAGKSKTEIDAELSPLFNKYGVEQTDNPRAKFHQHICMGKELSQREPLAELPEVIKTSELSTQSQELLQSFGLEAMAVLNEYAVSAEDALLEAVKAQQETERQYQDALDTVAELMQYKRHYLAVNG